MTELPHAPPGPARTDAIFDCLRILHRALDRHGIWHSLAFGTMLGAVRGGDLIPWDDDFDLLLRPADLHRVMALSGELGREGISFSQVLRPGNQLALDRRGYSTFSSGAISIIREGKKLGDFFLFHLFRDGVLRRYDFAREIYWCPHSSFPAFFVEELRQVTLRGESFPTLLHTERWLEFVYGADWRVPVKSKRAVSEDGPYNGTIRRKNEKDGDVPGQSNRDAKRVEIAATKLARVRGARCCESERDGCGPGGREGACRRAVRRDRRLRWGPGFRRYRERGRRCGRQ